MIAKFAAVCVAGLAFAGSALGCDMSYVEVRSGDTVVRFDVEIADTVEERAQGLMHRTDLPQFSGMLFVYDRPQPVAFWMKNTPLPLDMLFIEPTGRIARIARETTPFSTETVPGGDGILQVLEINGGTSDLLGIGEGAVIRHPTLDPELALWPCDGS